MVEVTIGNSRVCIECDTVEGMLYIDGEPARSQLITEFENEILQSPIPDCTEEEVCHALKSLGKQLDSWVRNKDAWQNWKEFARDLQNK